MKQPRCIGKMLLAALLAISLAAMPPALALENPQPPCCCATHDQCDKPAAQSPCPCAACPAVLHAQPLAIMVEKNRPLPFPESSPRWPHRNEQAAERRSAPPVPPPRITA